MQFELDELLMDEILFYMENQEGDFLLDAQEGRIVSLDDDIEEDLDFDDEERFIALPEWSPQDGYRLMERFAAGLRNPVVREELCAALNRGKGVFRSFKNALEQHGETEKLWFKFKDREMRNEAIAWYNSYRETRGLALLGVEPEDTSSLILEDFVLHEGTDADAEKASLLHELCVKERKPDTGQGKALLSVFEAINPRSFPGDLCFVAETRNSDFAGAVYAVKNAPSSLHIFCLEVQPEYRGLGLGKALLSRLLEKADERGITSVTADLPAETENFSRALRLENFTPCVQRFVRVSN
jgi:ribosomal protein S18 acetylase RimI-like enzyme